MPENDAEDSAFEAREYHIEEYAEAHALGYFEHGERPGVDVPRT